MAVALQGAVVVSQDGTMVTYRHKCDKCGHLETGSTHVQTPGSGVYMRSSFGCTKCKQRQEVEIQGEWQWPGRG